MILSVFVKHRHYSFFGAILSIVSLAFQIIILFRIWLFFFNNQFYGKTSFNVSVIFSQQDFNLTRFQGVSKYRALMGKNSAVKYVVRSSKLWEMIYSCHDSWVTMIHMAKYMSCLFNHFTCHIHYEKWFYEKYLGGLTMWLISCLILCFSVLLVCEIMGPWAENNMMLSLDMKLGTVINLIIGDQLNAMNLVMFFMIYNNKTNIMVRKHTMIY